MTVALSFPYEDELLYNVISRYMEATCVDAPTSVVRNLFGRVFHPTVELLCGLGELSRQTYDSWGLSAQEIAQRYTPLPYFTSYATAQRFASAYSAACGDGGTRPSALLGRVATRVEGALSLRYCEQCASEDISRIGETYWRRSHQLPGVFACIRHKRPLLNSAASLKLRSYRGWHTGNSVIAAATNAEAAGSFVWTSNSDVFDVMRISTELLASESSLLRPRMHEHYYFLAREAGFAKPSGLIDAAAVRREMRDLYGDEYLADVGLSFPSAPKEAWPVAMMQRVRAAYQPLQHILLNHFLNRCKRKNGNGVAQQNLTANQQFTCPNRYAAHEGAHILERVKVEVRDGARIARGYCSCGLKFTFRRCKTGTSEPEILEIFAFGRDWCEAAKEMKRNGMTTSEIANEMAVSWYSVKAMLKRRTPPEPNGNRGEILKWRRQWKTLLKEVAPGGHKAARAVNHHLYYLLNRHDKDWLKESARPYIQARNTESKRVRVDWQARDKQWSAILKAAAEKLLVAETRLMRASRTAIVAEADLYLLHKSVLHKLPLCQAVLAEKEESVEDFQLRRLEEAAKRLGSNGDPVLRWRLLALAAIPTSRLTPRLKAAVARLASHA